MFYSFGVYLLSLIVMFYNSVVFVFVVLLELFSVEWLLAGCFVYIVACSLLWYLIVFMFGV